MKRTLAYWLTAAALTLAPLATGATLAHAQGIDHYEQESGSSRALGGGVNPGDAAKEVSNPGRLVFFQVVGVDAQGRTFGYLRWSASNAFIAATNDCDAVTTKDSASSNGTVLTWDDAGSGTHRWLFRYCNYQAMSGPGSVGAQFKVRAQGAGGYFQRFVRVNP